MSKLLLIKPKVLSTTKKVELKEAGYIVIETDNPKDVIVVDEYGELDRDTLLSTALTALDCGNDSTARNAFGTLLRKKLLSKISETGKK